MSASEIVSIITILIISAIFVGLLKFIQTIKSNQSEVYNFDKDYKNAVNRPTYSADPQGEATYIGHTSNKKGVFIPNEAKHVFVCGTTGSGKTVALANFLKSGVKNDYPMLVVDGKGDTGEGSLLEITKDICKDRKIYVINLNDPENSDKYNPFKNTNPDVIKDMLINMTEWSEPHYKFNTERYIQRLCCLLELSDIEISFESLIKYMPAEDFVVLSEKLSDEKLITKEQHIENTNLARANKEIIEGAAARFATIKESKLGQIFDVSGIDIYTALQENAVILFILNPLLYPETSPLIGNLIVIDSKKAVSNLYANKKKRIFYILDEINVYANTSLLDLVNKSRSANVTCVLATQSLSDLDGVTDQLKEQIIENCNNYIVLRQNSPVNSEYWANVIGTRETMHPTYQVDSGESTGLGSLRKVHEYIYHPQIIKHLEQGKAIFVSRDKMFHTKIHINKPF